MPTPRELLPAFYQQYHLGEDGGQTSTYVKIEFTNRLFIYIPNSDARRKAVLKHDIHHLATGYTSTFKGETEIAAWEIGSGCTRYWVAFLLNLHGIAIGAFFNAAGVYKAFVKGRHTKNLYNSAFTDEQLMDMPISTIKEYLLLNNYTLNSSNSFADTLLFIWFVLVGSIYGILSLVLLPFTLIYTLYIVLSGTVNKRSS